MIGRKQYTCSFCKDLGKWAGQFCDCPLGKARKKCPKCQGKSGYTNGDGHSPDCPAHVDLSIRSRMRETAPGFCFLCKHLISEDHETIQHLRLRVHKECGLVVANVPQFDTVQLVEFVSRLVLPRTGEGEWVLTERKFIVEGKPLGIVGALHQFYALRNSQGFRMAQWMPDPSYGALLAFEGSNGRGNRSELMILPASADNTDKEAERWINETFKKQLKRRTRLRS